jgi:dipeptide/tripeptide permease
MLIAFVLMFFSTVYAVDSKISLLALVVFIVIISLSEILLQPISYTMVNQMIVEKDRPVFYAGVGFLTKSVAPVMMWMGMFSILKMTRADQVDYYSIVFLCISVLLAVALTVLKIFLKK